MVGYEVIEKRKNPTQQKPNWNKCDTELYNTTVKSLLQTDSNRNYGDTKTKLSHFSKALKIAEKRSISIKQSTTTEKEQT